MTLYWMLSGGEASWNVISASWHVLIGKSDITRWVGTLRWHFHIVYMYVIRIVNWGFETDFQVYQVVYRRLIARHYSLR